MNVYILEICELLVHTRPQNEDYLLILNELHLQNVAEIAIISREIHSETV